MQIKAKVIKVYPEISGKKKDGETWKRQDIIVETVETYSKKIALILQDKFIDKVKEGYECTFSVNIESREFNERWYTDVRVWKIDYQNSNSNNKPAETQTPVNIEANKGSDDLPF